MAKQNEFTIISDLKEYATYLEILGSAPHTHPDFARKMEIAARLMRKASRMLELEDDGHIPHFLLKQAN